MDYITLFIAAYMLFGAIFGFFLMLLILVRQPETARDALTAFGITADKPLMYLIALMLASAFSAVIWPWWIWVWTKRLKASIKRERAERREVKLAPREGAIGRENVRKAVKVVKARREGESDVRVPVQRGADSNPRRRANHRSRVHGEQNGDRR